MMVKSEDQVMKAQENTAEDSQSITHPVELCSDDLTVIERNNKRINDLSLLCDERLATIVQLQQLCADKDITLNNQRYTLNKMKNALTWRATAFIRKGFGALKRSVLSSTQCTLVPMAGLTSLNKSGAWKSFTDDPSFFIKPANPSIYNTNSIYLVFDFESADEGLIGEIFFDTGDGFLPYLSLKFELFNGINQLALSLPKNCSAMRFDPAMSQSEFKISDVIINLKPKSAYESVKFINSPRELNYVAQYDRSIVGHTLGNQLVATAEEVGAWESTGDDPYFILHCIDLKEGWNLVNVSITSADKKVFIGRLYFDYGEGFDEKNSENIIIKSGVISNKVILINDKVKNLRFDPMESKGALQLNVLSITKLSKYKANRLISEALTAKKTDASGSIFEKYKIYQESFSPLTNTMDYNAWIENKEFPQLLSREEAVNSINSFSFIPKISIVIPTYNTEEKFLRLCIDSVLNQHYSNIEVCIADDYSTDLNVRKVLSEYEKNDARVKVILRSENGHISNATNSALELATGDYIALLDHDDELPLSALYEVVRAINNNPECNIIYSDEDKIDGEGNRFEPHFKSAWNPDLLFSQNYISHLGVYKKNIIDNIQGFRVGVEGSQDYDLLLRAIKECDSKGVIHIPKILYHWRAISGSTALEEGEKNYTSDSGKKALEDYFSDIEGIEVSEGLHANTYKVNWPIPKDQPLVSLIIPTYNGYEITKQAIDSILDKTTYKNYEILLVDNNSNCPIALEYFKSLEKISNITVLRYPYPFNYSAINNFAAKQAKGGIIGFINNDVEVISPNWLTELVSHALRSDIGCVGAKLYFENDTIQHGGVIVGLGGVAGHSHKYFKRTDPGYFRRLSLVQNLSAVTAAVLVVRKEVFEEVGGLNEVDLTVAFNDVDFCLKVMDAGYRNLWTPYAELYHYESISRGAENDPVKIARFNSEMEYMRNTWGGGLLVDRYYNENLTTAKEDFSLGA
jgi:glycosyltransferase involved in cell wall biosynthesis